MKPFLLILGLLLASTSIFAQNDDVKSHEEVEQMPLFKSDCPEGEDQKMCSTKKMLHFVYGNVKYPRQAAKKKAEGMVVVSFIVEKDGMVSTIEIYSDEVGYGASEEVLRLIASMNEDGPAWEPGLIDGEPVRVAYMLPVKFKR